MANARCQRTEWIASPFLVRKLKVPRDLPPISSNPLKNRTRFLSPTMGNSQRQSATFADS
uniref:Uncharacterized protein n=1 Tax=Romanomermis culicivorax TaxID=13658 RepID=A0A915KLQ1_ROMCU